jgi:ubiquinone/menaquinone biosynthesis C-methylase UbiE
LVIHHLSRTDKLRAFREVRRVLKPGGTFHVVDFGMPFNGLSRLQAGIMRNLEEAADNFDGKIVPFLREAGFENPRQDDPMDTIFGPLWFYRAFKGTD